MNRTQALRILNLNEGYSEQDLKKAYRLLSKKTHPDIVGGDGSNFRLVTQAYELLQSNRNGVVRQPLSKRGRVFSHGSKLFEYRIV